MHEDEEEIVLEEGAVLKGFMIISPTLTIESKKF